MKANAPKRKVFQDAVDLISPPEEMINPVNSGQTMISVKKVVPFHNHPFRLYEGKRLDDMVESIKEHGVLIPVIVQKITNGYEMLLGNHRGTFKIGWSCGRQKKRMKKILITIV